MNGVPDAGYQVATRRHDEAYVDPDSWSAQAPAAKGSWWSYWQQWLAERSGPRAAPPAMGAPGAGLPVLGPAPGNYVLQH
jgi:polyhydroxyalkanoate synthase